MTEREIWPKPLNCPACGLEGVAQMSHVDDPSSQFGTRTIIEDCPKGFVVRPDEDDSNIFRFFCAADNVAADQ